MRPAKPNPEGDPMPHQVRRFSRHLASTRYCTGATRRQPVRWLFSSIVYNLPWV